jgi:predicted HTH transcriptional regulator
LEFKAARTGFDGGRLMDYCVGISNDGGGKLILGVTNAPPREVVGTLAINDTQDMQKKVLDKLHFEVKIEEIIHPKGRVIVCHIPTRPPGTALHHDGRYWMRSGEELRAMSPDRLREIFNEGKPDWLMRTARDNCSASDVIQLLDTQSYFDLLDLPYPMSRGGVLERFESEKFIVDEGDYSITNLGAVLFAKRLDAFEGLSRKAPRVMVYDGTDKLEQGKGVDRVVAFAETWQLPAPDWRAGERHTTAIMFAHKKFSEMDGKDRVRACFQHCVLRWMTNQKMTNTSLRERFNLPESKSETVSRIIADAIQQEKIKPVDPTSTSKRYANYVPRWA